MSSNDAAELTSAFFMYMFHVFFYFCGVKKSVQFAHVDLDYVCSPKAGLVIYVFSTRNFREISYISYNFFNFSTNFYNPIS